MGFFDKVTPHKAKTQPYWSWECTAALLEPSRDMAAFVIESPLLMALQDLSKRHPKLPRQWAIKHYAPHYDEHQKQAFLNSLNSRDWRRFVEEGEELPYKVIPPIGAKGILTAADLPPLQIEAGVRNWNTEGLRRVGEGAYEKTSASGRVVDYHFFVFTADLTSRARVKAAQRTVDAVYTYGLL